MPQRKLDTSLGELAILKQQLAESAAKNHFKSKKLKDLLADAGDVLLGPLGLVNRPTPDDYTTIDTQEYFPKWLLDLTGRARFETARTHTQPGMPPGLPARVIPIGRNPMEKAIDFLTRSALEPNLAVEEKKRLIEKSLDMFKDVMYGTRSSWKDSIQGREVSSVIKEALNDPKYLRRAAMSPLDVTEDEIRRAQIFEELVSKSPKTYSTLFRASKLEEIPELRIGAEFENPFLSFSQGTKGYREAQFRNPNTGLMILPAGSRALPMTGITRAFNEAEFISGGKFKIEDILEIPRQGFGFSNPGKRTVVKLKQLEK